MTSCPMARVLQHWTALTYCWDLPKTFTEAAVFHPASVQRLLVKSFTGLRQPLCEEKVGRRFICSVRLSDLSLYSGPRASCTHLIFDAEGNSICNSQAVKAFLFKHNSARDPAYQLWRRPFQKDTRSLSRFSNTKVGTPHAGALRTLL